MLQRFLAWCRQPGTWRWLSASFHILLAAGLVAAIILVLLIWWDRQTAWIARTSEAHGAGEMMVIANAICEARLDRMQQVFETFLAREAQQGQYWQACCDQRSTPLAPEAR